MWRAGGEGFVGGEGKWEKCARLGEGKGDYKEWVQRTGATHTHTATPPHGASEVPGEVGGEGRRAGEDEGVSLSSHPARLPFPPFTEQWVSLLTAGFVDTCTARKESGGKGTGVSARRGLTAVGGGARVQSIACSRVWSFGGLVRSFALVLLIIRVLPTPDFDSAGVGQPFDIMYSAWGGNKALIIPAAPARKRTNGGGERTGTRRRSTHNAGQVGSVVDTLLSTSAALKEPPLTKILSLRMVFIPRRREWRRVRGAGTSGVGGGVWGWGWGVQRRRAGGGETTCAASLSFSALSFKKLVCFDRQTTASGHPRNVFVSILARSERE